ncbi:MAG: porin family protein [Rhizobiales bacterium]|nr:porin family protein [Hyphomicrobiales bacterium]
MKKTILAMTVASLVAAAGTATAADLPRSSAPYYSPAPAVYNWGGGYAGLNVGYEWGRITNSSISPSGLEGGLQAGYNWQSGQFVFGGETDIQVTGADDTFAPYKFANPWFGTLRGRAGYAMNNILFYGTFGLAYGQIKGTFAGLDESKTHAGWAGGLGMEVGFTPNWSAKIEYLYMDLSNRAYSITGTTNGFETNMVRFGINYHF